MTTSLAAQLKKLAAPQTSLLTHSKKKASLLFDPREAAKFDRDTIYEIGISGLQELIKLNPKFAEYETSLFNSDSRSVERSVEDKKANKKLNKLIRHFLLLLSPYFLIKASHKALEWLINRYHIESFNVDDLMSLIFPYHSTRIFVRVLQIMDLSDPANKWHWLYPLQGPGVPLSKQALLNRCASDPFFMHFICKTTSDAVKEHKGRGSSLATLLAFHCTTLIGGLEYANKVNEVQMTHILKTLLEGLASPVIDYAAASYMIMGQLVLRVKLSHHIFSGILNKVVKCPHSSLSGECLLLIVLMYQNQYTEDMPPVQTKTFNRLIRLSWLPRALKQLKDAGVHVNLFFESLLREVLLNIQSRTEDREEICKFAENLLDNMMDSNSAIHIMEIILQTLDVDSLTLKEEALPEGKKDAEKETDEDEEEKKEENEDKEVDDEEEKEKERIEEGKEEDGAEKKEDEDDDDEKEKNEECKEGNKHGEARQYEENKTELTTLVISDREEILKWYLQVFKSLEKKYSEAYDILIHRYLSKENASNNCARAIRLVLSVAVEGAGTADRIDMFQRLHHPSSALRAAAVKHLVDNYETLSEDDRELIFSSLGARLKDEDRKVLRNVLLFPTKVLVEVLGADTALEELISLSVYCFDKDKKWTEVWILLVQHLCSEQLHADTPFAEVRILFALLPFFFIHTRRICHVIMNQHNFVNKFKLLTSLTKELKPSEKLKKWEICSAFINSLTEAQTSLDTETLFQCAKYFSSKKQKAMHIFLLLLVVGSSVPEHLQLSLSQSILDLFTSCISTYKVPVVPGEIMESSGMVLSQCVKKVLSGEIPLSAYLFCISKLTQNTLLSSYLKSNDRKWWDLDFSNEGGDKTALRFTVRMLEVILTGCSASSRNVRFCYAVCLKQYFKAHFSNLASQVRFLCNVCACPGTKDDGIAWPELKLRCLRLLTTLLEVPNSSFSWALNLSEPVVPALMTAAFSPVTPLRHTALNCLLKIGSSFGANLNDDTYVTLLDKIKERYEEFMMDPDQLSVVMYTALSPDPAVQSLLEPSEKPQLNGIRTTLLNCITSRDTPAYVVRTLLQMMGAINSKGIMFSLTPLGHAALKSGESDGWVDEYRSGILCDVLQRLDSDTAECLQRKECWDFLQSALLDWKTNVIQSSGERTYPSILVLQQISRELFDKLTETTQAELLSLIIRAASDSDAPEVGSAASKAVKKIILDSKLVATELEKMKNAEVPEEQQTASGMRLRSKRKVNQAPSPLLLQTEAWRHGVTLLEWIQSKKKLQSTQLLLSPLFSVLSKCLEFEQQPPVEYTKQLVLSCLLHCCQKLSPDGGLVDKSIVQAFNVEAIVQCIRASQNPQTHHHALLLLAHIAGMMPEQVLHNIMAIFTFMGSSVLRHDDAYSFQVISKIVDTVIPILVKASEGMTEKNLEVDSAVCSVLRVFADTVLHVPEHRRMLLYQKLLTTLGPDTSLWLFICLVLEGHVVHGQEEQSEKNKRERGEIPHRQEFALNLTRCFPPASVITTCIKLMKYVQTLPAEKGQTAKCQKPTSSLALSLVPGLFNVDVHTAKELRHYRFSVCTFMSSLLSSPQFVKQVAELSDEDILQLEPLYQELIENLLTHIKSLSHQHYQAMQKNKPEQTIKYWSAVLNVSYDILDKVNALLPCDMFLLVIRGLLNHKLSTIRRKSMELLNTRLQHQASIFSKCERQAFYNLLEPLVTVMGSIGLEGTDPDTEINQQVAMLSIKLLARQLAPDDPAHFKQILERVIELMRSPEVQKNLLASVVLCLAELISSLRAHAIGQLNQFMPAIIRILRDQKELESPNLVLLSVVTATQKIVEILPNFLSPYLDKLLFEISIQSTKWQHLSEDNKVAPVHNKLKTIRQKISSTIPARVLTPAVGRCYAQLIEQRQYSALGPLLGILGDSFSSLASSEFSQIMPDLTSFFLSALQFRGDSRDTVPQEDIVEVESHVTKALVALILKLSESTFRPLYYSLFHWATSVEAHKDRIITFYGLSSSIAEALKGLFVLFAGRLIQNAAKLLDVLNVNKKNKEEKDEKVVFDDEKAQLLLQYILQTLHRIFLHDSGQGFINKERFDALMFPLTNQLENTLGGVDQLQSRATSLLSPCISQFAVAVADDALWKQLNYQILLKTRNDLPQVRLAALEVLCEMARKLGEDFLPLLPETVPFLAELLEDEEETVETACQKAVQDLEEILGEPIKKYF